MQEKKTIEYFDALEALRGVGAVVVVVRHIDQLNYPDATFLMNGPVSLDLFFMLSGFVLAYSYRERLQKGMSAYEFVLRRLIRLYPMYFFGLIFGSAVQFCLPARSWYHYPSQVLTSLKYNILFLPYVHHWAVFPANLPLWSTAFEMLGCLAFLFLVRLRLKPLLVFALLSYLVTLVGSIEQVLTSDGQQVYELFVNGGYESRHVWLGVPRVLYGVACGILIYECRNRWRGTKLVAWFQRVRHQQTLLCASLVLTWSFPSMLRGTYYFALLGFFSPVVLYLGAMAEPANERSKTLAHFLGWLSYPIYCIHFPIALAVKSLDGEYPFNASSRVLPILEGLTISMIFAAILAMFYDEPVRKYLSSVLRSHLQGRKSVKCNVS